MDTFAIDTLYSIPAILLDMKSVPYQAPNFSLQNQDDETVSLSDFAGKWLIVYFYPKDDTPGCTAEACSVRDSYDDLSGINASVVGVSADSVASHKAFQEKYGLNFDLLSDPDKKVIKAYGAWGKKMFGREGIQRKTFIISPDQQVVKVYGQVTPLGHGEALAADIAQLQNS